MSKPQKPQKLKPPRDVELVDDAWPRFEKMVKAIAKAGPQHKLSTRPTRKPRNSKS